MRVQPQKVSEIEKYFGVYQCVAINRQEKLLKNLVGIGFWCTFALVFIRMNV